MSRGKKTRRRGRGRAVLMMALTVILVFCCANVVLYLYDLQGGGASAAGDGGDGAWSTESPPAETAAPTPVPETPEAATTPPATEPPAPTPTPAGAPDIRQVLSEADRLAAGYDFDAAEALISAVPDYLSRAELTGAMSRYEQAAAAMVRYPDPATIPHIFFHSLIVDPARAFDGDSMQDGYNLYMVTVGEFEDILQQLYDKGYVLVTIHDIARRETRSDGSEKFVPGDIYLPPNKKPLVMSQDDVNYYEYMTDSDGDHYADAGGDGFATRLVIGGDGYPTCEYIAADGRTLTGDYDLVPILERFIQAHPDFSYRGARAIIGVTGYEGVFGYRTHPDWEAIYGSEEYNKEVAEAKEVAQCLLDRGWEIASHSFGHPAYGEISTERVQTDVQRWEDQVQPIVGDTDIFLYPFGSDISGVEGYSGAKFDALYNAGYRYFCNVDSAKYWVQIHDGYVRQARRNIDGYRMYWNPNLLADLFDVSAVLDPARPLPVPAI